MPSFDLRCAQKDALIIPFKILDTAGTPSIAEGGSYLAVSDGGVGIYAVTFTGFYGRNSAREPVVLVSAITSSTGEEVIANVISSTVAGFTVEVNDDAGTGVDRSVYGMVIWFGVAQPQ